jgi:hypothetical protein
VKEFIIAMLDEFDFFWQVVLRLLLSMDYSLPPQTFFAIAKELHHMHKATRGVIPHHGINNTTNL